MMVLDGKTKKVIKGKILLISLCMVILFSFASAELLDYDTFTRSNTDFGEVGVTEGNNNVYFNYVNEPNALNFSRILDNQLLINLSDATIYESHALDVNFSDVVENNFTIYLKLKSTINTQYIEVYTRQYSSTSIATIIGVSSYESWAGDWGISSSLNEGANISADNWVEMWFYLDAINNIVNLTLTDGISIYTYERVSNVNDFNKLGFYFEAGDNGTNNSILYIDEWAVCSGYDINCSPIVCEPDWVCSGYGSCNISDEAPCNNVSDINSCGQAYSGDYSEFEAQSCDYCVAVYPEPVIDLSTCNINGSKSIYNEVTNYDTCCNVTGLLTDCPFGIGVENTTQWVECSFQFSYNEGDVSPAIVNLITKGIIFVGTFISIFVIIYLWVRFVQPNFRWLR